MPVTKFESYNANDVRSSQTRQKKLLVLGCVAVLLVTVLAGLLQFRGIIA